MIQPFKWIGVDTSITTEISQKNKGVEKIY